MESKLPQELADEFRTIERYMAKIHREMWKLENQGSVDEDNISAIISHLASAHYYVRKAKWRGVEHLRVGGDTDMLAG
jgi:hypothetical protein